MPRSKKTAEMIQKLEKFRTKIDQTDYQLLSILNTRLRTVQDIARLKTELKIPVLQKERWQEVLKNRLKLGEEKFQLNPQFTKKLYSLIHDEALRVQRKINRRKAAVKKVGKL